MAAITYALRPGFVLAAPVESVGARITELQRRNASPERPEGHVTAEEVVADAADPGSPLHRCFEWDDSEAARRHRLGQARYLMRSYEVVIERPDRPPLVLNPGNVVVTEPDRSRVHVPTASAMSRPDDRRQVLAEALGQLRGVQARLSRLKGVSSQVDEGLRELIALMEREASPKPKVKAEPPAKAGVVAR